VVTLNTQDKSVAFNVWVPRRVYLYLGLGGLSVFVVLEILRGNQSWSTNSGAVRASILSNLKTLTV